MFSVPRPLQAGLAIINTRKDMLAKHTSVMNVDIAFNSQENWMNTSVYILVRIWFSVDIVKKVTYLNGLVIFMKNHTQTTRNITVHLWIKMVTFVARHVLVQIIWSNIRGMHGEGWNCHCSKRFSWPGTMYTHKKECQVKSSRSSTDS